MVAPLKNASISSSFDEEQVEAYIMGCARRGELNVRVDHKAGSLTFIDDPFASPELPQASTSTAAPREVSVQPSTSDLVRTRLSKVASSLHKALETIDGDGKRGVLTPEEQATQFKTLSASVEVERKALLHRRALIARRRELLSELNVKKEKEETTRLAEMTKKSKEDQARRLKEELRRKEQEKTQKEIESIRIDEAKKYAQTLVDKGILKANQVEVS